MKKILIIHGEPKSINIEIILKKIDLKLNSPDLLIIKYIERIIILKIMILKKDLI